MNSLPPEIIAYQEAHIHETRTPVLIGVCSVFTGLVLLTLGLRLASRALAGVKLGLDDYLACATAFLLVGLNISACLVGHFGIGRHLLFVAQDPENFVRIGKTELAYSVFYDWTMASAKLTILALLARVFTFNERWFKIGIWFWATWTILWWVASWFITFLECRPLSTTWGVPYQCRPAFRTSVSAAIFNVISDVGILLLPQLHIWRLNVVYSKKVALCGVFLVGIFATIVSIVRIPLLKGANSTATTDSTWTSVVPVILTVLEPAAASACGNLPMTPGFFSRLIPKLSTSFRSIFSIDHSKTKSRKVGSPSESSNWIRLDHSTGSRSKSERPGTINVFINDEIFAPSPRQEDPNTLV